MATTIQLSGLDDNYGEYGDADSYDMDMEPDMHDDMEDDIDGDLDDYLAYDDDLDEGYSMSADDFDDDDEDSPDYHQTRKDMWSHMDWDKD